MYVWIQVKYTTCSYCNPYLLPKALRATYCYDLMTPNTPHGGI